jgi:NADP-reducing hydrogenase subunit HndD
MTTEKTDSTMVSITIDNLNLSVESGTTIAEAASRVGVTIPTLCYHPKLSIPGACRVCIVDVKDRGHYMAACSVHVWDGMVVETNSPEIRQARRDIVELLLDNHTQDCQTCERSGNCELQNLANSLGIRERLFEGARKDLPEDHSGVSVARNPNKCILCGRCIRVCSETQAINNLSQHGRGFTTVVCPAHGRNMDESTCIQCGQCITVCPTAALLEKNDTEAVWSALANPEKHVVVQTAPAIRAAIGEGFGLPPGTPSTGRMVAALRRLGFDGVFDTNFGADLTIVEESTEFLKRLENNGPFPMFTSCSPGWINYLEKFHPALIPHASTCRSPMSMTSALLKTYYAEQKGLRPQDIYVVAVMPCVAKKYEAGRKDHTLASGEPLTDAVITTRELIWMIKSYGVDYWTASHIDLDTFPRDTFDDPLGISSGAGDIFGTTGGVMEATLRTAVEKLSKGTVHQIDFMEVRSVEGIRESVIDVAGKKLTVAVVNGLNNTAQILNEVASGKEYHLIEIMACPGGCVGGGGQPYPPKGMKPGDPTLLWRRANALYVIDSEKPIRRSHENPAIDKLYAEFLGHPGSDKAHHLLHTSYSAKLPRGIR